MKIPSWVNRYIGIPFRDDGHDYDGCNCWGLCHLVLKNECGIETPSYGELSAADLLAAARKFRSIVAVETWEKVDDYRAFDCVLMHAMSDDRSLRLPGHVGILISPSRVLHVWSKTAAVHMPIDHPRVRNKIIAVYRHKALA